MNKEDLEKELEKIGEMTPEEFAENYLKDTVFPTARNEEEARYISEHSGVDDESDAPNAVKWFENLIDSFCFNNDLDRENDIYSFFQIVGWENGITFSAGVTVYFKTKEVAEMFAKLIREDDYCSGPNTNYTSEYGDLDVCLKEEDEDEWVEYVPKGLHEFPFYVEWYVDVRDNWNNRRYNNTENEEQESHL